jgi:hypothetical protein
MCMAKFVLSPARVARPWGQLHMMGMRMRLSIYLFTGRRKLSMSPTSWERMDLGLQCQFTIVMGMTVGSIDIDHLGTIRL